MSSGVMKYNQHAYREQFAKMNSWAVTEESLRMGARQGQVK